MFKVELGYVREDVTYHFVVDRPAVKQPHQLVYVFPVLDISHQFEQPLSARFRVRSCL
jgi:hypothetical protein